MIYTSEQLALDPSMVEVADRVGNQAILAIAAGHSDLAGALLLLHAHLLGGLVLTADDTQRVLSFLDEKNAEWREHIAKEFRH